MIADRGLLCYACFVHVSSRFPPPWSVDELEACFVEKDDAGQKLAYVYFEDGPSKETASCADWWGFCRTSVAELAESLVIAEIGAPRMAAPGPGPFKAPRPAMAGATSLVGLSVTAARRIAADIASCRS